MCGSQKADAGTWVLCLVALSGDTWSFQLVKSKVLECGQVSS